MSYVSSRSTKQHIVNSQAEMLALKAQPGDLATRTDARKNFILSRLPASSMLNWSVLSTYSQDLAVTREIGDWVLSGIDYKLVIQHNLGTKYVQATVYEKETAQLVNYGLTITDENSITLTGSAVPDCRRAVLVQIEAIVL